MIENSVQNECVAPYRQIRIFKGIGECPNEKNASTARRLYWHFCLCIYKGPARHNYAPFQIKKLTMGDCWLPPLALRVQTTNQSNQHYQIVVRQFPHSIKSLLDELRVVFLCIKKLKWG